MNEQEKLEVLAEIFDCDAGELSPDKQLDELPWDSMAMLSVIAMAKTRFDRKITGTEIRAFSSVQDILNVMEK
jgi:acyl carrier protein